MADIMNFDLVSPERSLASFVATEVQIPGSEGDMTVMLNHAPILTTLRPGVLSVSGADGVSEYVITGGFAEVTAEGVTVIAEHAMVQSEVTQSDMDGIVSLAQLALDSSNEANQDASIKMHADVVNLAAILGLSSH